MIDFHSHILPDMDDGSKSVDESVAMLRLSFNMGIDTIVSTSHYYANHDTIDSFLSRRNCKQKVLQEGLVGLNDIPKIVMGAEVSFFSGMSREKEITSLCIDNTKYMLLEMPFFDWSSLTIAEIKNLISNRGITPIIAHIERYLPYQYKNGKIDALLNMGVVFQANSEALCEGVNKRKMLSMIDTNVVHILGSDCHNTIDRMPNLDQAFKIIGKKLGNTTLEMIDTNGRRILNDELI